MRIGICIPLTKHLDGAFFKSFIDTLNEVTYKYEVEVITRIGDSLDRCRNELVKTALRRECTHVWFIDADHIIPSGALDRLISLMDEQDVDIVSGLYFTRSAPHFPVIKRLRDGIFENIFDYSGVVEVDGVGFGCCLVKASLFEKVGFPFFEFRYDNLFGFEHYCSEDLVFCKKVRGLGFKILVDTDLVIPHIGGLVDESNYLHIKDSYLKADKVKDELISDLMDFDNFSEAEVRVRILNGTESLKKEWLDKNPKTKEERNSFYRNSFWSKYDLAYWHLGKRIKFDYDLVEMIKSKYPKDVKILDFGCGIGHNSYLLAKEGFNNITLYDLNPYFAHYRFNKHKLPYREDFGLDEKFDVILCFDVLEHLDDEEYKEVISLFKRLIKPGGVCLVQVSWGDSGFHPMHFVGTREKVELLKELMVDE